jgi:dTDP-4-dehydrorhamnose reductase
VKLLLFGRDGQVGRALGEVLPRLGDTIVVHRSAVDFERPDEIRHILDREQPDVIVNAVAYTAVDAAVDDRARAFAVNATAVGVIADAARKNDALVVHYSTDCVFDGNAEGYQPETQPTNPVSVYGASKLEGERLLVESGAAYLILRISWIYAIDGRNFPLTVLWLARERNALDMVADEFGAATSATLVAVATLEAIRQTVADRSKAGLYHLAAAGSASRYELARYIVEEARAAGAQLSLVPDAIRPIAARDFPAKARRPSNSRLDTTKFRTVFGTQLPPWQEGIGQLIKTLRAGGHL